MSLYIGNLSNHISGEDLEHVFRKFGQCRIQMKEGFGFAVYEFRGNAERALRELRGRNICGEALTLTWSNKQPKPYQNFGRASSFHDSRRGGNVYRGNCGRRGFSLSLSRGHGRSRFNRFGSVGGDRQNSVDVFDEEKAQFGEDVGSSCRDVSRHSAEDVVAGPDRIDSADSGRWYEPAQMLPDLNGPAPADGVEFDRYNPYRSYVENDDGESHRLNCEEGSESLGISRHDDGHERARRDASPDSILQRKDSGNTNHNSYGKLKLKSVESHGRTKPKSRESSYSARETSSTGRHLSDGNDPISKQKQKILSDGSSYRREGTDTSQKNDNARKRWSEKRNCVEKLVQHKNTKSLVSSALCGQSPEGLHSTGVRISFSYSMASSLSDDYENRSQKSRSRSRSFSSLSTPASHGQLFATSANKTPLDEDNSMGNATLPISPGDPNENVELFKSTAEVGNISCDTPTAMAVDETGILVAKKSNSIDHDHNALDDGADIGAVTISPDKMKISSCSSMADSLDACQKSLHENLAALSNNKVVPMGHEAVPSNSSLATAVNSSNSARCSSNLSEEIFAVLNHYGLMVPKENERHTPAEEFLGSARMWPWPIIYYRRLRKGPISVDNYAKRVLQNKEYGIIDKFVRSSSGWGELTELAD